MQIKNEVNVPLWINGDMGVLDYNYCRLTIIFMKDKRKASERIWVTPQTLSLLKVGAAKRGVTIGELVGWMTSTVIGRSKKKAPWDLMSK